MIQSWTKSFGTAYKCSKEANYRKTIKMKNNMIIALLHTKKHFACAILTTRVLTTAPCVVYNPNY